MDESEPAPVTLPGRLYRGAMTELRCALAATRLSQLPIPLFVLSLAHEISLAFLLLISE